MKSFVTVFPAAVLCSVFLPAAAGSAEAADPKAMRVVGNFSTNYKHVELEKPFFVDLPQSAGLEFRTSYNTMDAVNVKAEDALRLLRSGTFDVMSVQIGMAARDDPFLEGIDLVGVSTNLKDLLPPVVIFTLVMGSIYLGWATPTESAALAVVGAFALTALAGRLSFKMLHECFERTILITAMILLITSAAFYLTFVLGLMGVPEIMADFVTRLNASPSSLILALTIFYLILGCFFDALAMIVGTIPIVYPMTMAVGIDPIWFGIFLVLMAELALITPPMGMNLYVVQGVRKEGSISTVIVGTLPFLVVLSSWSSHSLSW